MRCCRPLAAVVLLLSILLAGCALHSGGDEIAFLQGGQLWLVNRDGSALVRAGGGGTVSFAWSPDHHQIVFRTVSRTELAAAGLPAPDAPGSLSVVGVDGGATLAITPEVAGLARSDAWWDGSGNRLLYREGFAPIPNQPPAIVVYIVSQADQPAGVARKSLPDGASLPALAADGRQVAWIDQDGTVRVSTPGASASKVVAEHALLTLAGGARPARVFWRPGHASLLYATLGADGTERLMAATLAGRVSSVANVPGLLDAAFTPDGSRLLTRTAAGFQLWSLNGAAAPDFTWPEDDPRALAWWAPDGTKLLVRDAHGIALVDVHARDVTQLLVAPATIATATAGDSWRPLASSPWSSDGASFVFSNDGTGLWVGQALPTHGGAGGVYVASAAHPRQLPALIHSGADTWPGWSALDASAS
ncbi:MAG TPA: hypothetical protein VGR57_02175, partial [Ktedonobacterales bacterium]|nr:hypothetical protein [Ktedonobacterales bacterium]